MMVSVGSMNTQQKRMWTTRMWPNMIYYSGTYFKLNSSHGIYIFFHYLQIPFLKSSGYWCQHCKSIPVLHNGALCSTKRVSKYKKSWPIPATPITLSFDVMLWQWYMRWGSTKTSKAGYVRTSWTNISNTLVYGTAKTWK